MMKSTTKQFNIQFYTPPPFEDVYCPSVMLDMLKSRLIQEFTKSLDETIADSINPNTRVTMKIVFNIDDYEIQK